MAIRWLAVITITFSFVNYVAAASTVTTLTTAVGCSNLKDFETYYDHEVKEGAIVDPLPTNCKRIPQGLDLVVLEPLKELEIKGKTRRFYLVQVPAADKGHPAETLWLPSYFVKKH